MIEIMPDNFSYLFRQGHQKTFEHPATLFRAGDRVASMYLVVSGSLRLTRNLKSGNRMILHETRAGHVAAEASAYSGHYHCDGEAIGPVTCTVVPIETFHANLATDATAASQWAAYLAESTQSARMLSQIRSLRTVSERLDAWLDTGHSLPPRGEWQSVADVLGVSREALYRELSRRK